MVGDKQIWVDAVGLQHEDFVLQVDICQKASTMEDTLDHQVDKLTQLVDISQPSP